MVYIKANLRFPFNSYRTRILIVYDESANLRVNYFYKVDLTTSAAKLTLSPLTEIIRERFSPSAERKSFFEKHMALSFFFDK